MKSLAILTFLLNLASAMINLNNFIVTLNPLTLLIVFANVYFIYDTARYLRESV